MTKKTFPFIPSITHCSLGLGLALAAINLASAQTTVPAPTLFYDFNSADGYTVESSGTAEMDLGMYMYTAQTPGAAAYGNWLGGTGPSGLPGDTTLNLSSATQMGGGTSYGGGAVGAGLNTVPNFVGAQSLTIAGWFYATQSPITTNAHLLNAFPGASDAGFRLAGLSGGSLQLSIVGSNARVDFNSNASYGAVESWVFFAVTFDNSGPGDAEVRFYVGGVDSEVTVASALLTGNVGNLDAGDRPLTIGNVSAAAGSFGTNRAFQGYIDNIGLWASATDGSGALTLDQLESLRMQQIPEPSTVACLFGALAGLLACFKMRRKV